MSKMNRNTVRNYGGKKYTWSGSFDTKREATAKAKQLRKQGKFVRIWNTIFRGKPAYWEIYVR